MITLLLSNIKQKSNMKILKLIEIKDKNLIILIWLEVLLQEIVLQGKLVLVKWRTNIRNIPFDKETFLNRMASF